MKKISLAAVCVICGTTGLVRGEDVAPADLFSQLDRNGDGKLVADEIPEGQFRFFERVVRIGDKNSDGAISVDEFTAALKQPTSEPSGPREQRPGGNPEMRDRPNPEELFQRLDKNGDGKVTREELPDRARERLAPLFDKLGTDSISLEQLRQYGPMGKRDGQGKPEMAGQGPGKGPPGEPGRKPQMDTPRDFTGERDGPGRPPMGPRPSPFIQALDEDGSGTLSQAELANVAKVFSQLDRNGDGELDPAELIGGPGPGSRGGDRPFMNGDRPPMEGEGRPGAMRDRGDNPLRPEGQQGPMFARMDANGDGVIDRDEAPERLRDRFADLDTNNDGKLTRDELMKGIQEGMRRPPANGGPRSDVPADDSKPSQRPQRPQ